MTTTKAIILTAVILATISFVVFGIREIKKNEKKSFGDPNSDRSSSDALNNAEQKTEFTLEDIINEINSKL